jgi:hypothetical protein
VVLGGGVVVGGAVVVGGGAVVGGFVTPNPPPPVVACGGVATIVWLFELRVARIAMTAPSPARSKNRSTGQIQSPGYHRWRRHGAMKLANHPVSVGSRSPHSRQYSWPGA